MFNVNGGTLKLTGGLIESNKASGAGKGDGVYQNGVTELSGVALQLKNNVYLAPGKALTVTASENGSISAMGFRPAQSRRIEIAMDASDITEGRDVAVYPTGNVPGVVQKNLFKLPASVLAYYRLENEPGRRNVLELHRPDPVYVDGVNGRDTNDGETPDSAFATLERAYQEFSNQANPNGGVIYIIDTVTLDSGVTELSDKYVSGGVTYDTQGTVSLIRYVQPTAHASMYGFTHATNTNPLIRVTGDAGLKLTDIVLDGHSEAVNIGIPKHDAPGATANAPLIVSDTNYDPADETAKDYIVTIENCIVQNAVSAGESLASSVGGCHCVKTVSLRGLRVDNVFEVGQVTRTGSPEFFFKCYLNNNVRQISARSC